jgi:protein-L-isoaspartate(D-aspartate) O-methyltransferase
VIPFLTLVMFLVSAPAAHAADHFLDARREMIREDIAGRGVRSPAVLRAMGAVPRHLFVPRRLARRAYGDFPLPIGEGQTISQPYVVALMTEALGLKGKERVLEIGTGSGYQAAVLAEIVAEVYSIEIIPSLAERSRRALEENGYGKVQVRNGDGYFGWPGKAPFDVIIITAAANHIPPPLLDQLKIGGRLILPLGRTTHTQTLTLVTKEKERFVVDQLGGVRFVPMVGDAQKARPDQAAPR